MTTKNTPSTPQDSPTLDKHWHLAQNDKEINFTELEFAIIRIGAAFDRWQKDCLACCIEDGLAGIDNIVLHMIRMHDRPKSISDLGRLMNRDDISNLQYSLRKLAHGGLIERASSKQSKRSATYVITDKGRYITEQFAQFRRELLLPLTDAIKNFDSDVMTACKVLSMVAGIYDQASSIAATHPRS